MFPPSQQGTLERLMPWARTPLMLVRMMMIMMVREMRRRKVMGARPLFGMPVVVIMLSCDVLWWMAAAHVHWVGFCF